MKKTNKLLFLLTLFITINNGSCQAGIWSWVSNKWSTLSTKTKISTIAIGASSLAVGALVWKYKDRLFNTDKNKNVTTLQNLARAKKPFNAYHTPEYWTKKLFEAIENDSNTNENSEWLAKAITAIKNGAQINALNNSNETPLLRAIEKLNVQMVDLLLNIGEANPRQKGAKSTAYRTACEKLYESATNLTSITDLNETDLFYDNAVKIKELIKKIPKPNIIKAARENNIKKLQECLERGDDINTQDAKGKTALHYAIKKGNLEIVQTLLNNKANTHILCDKYIMAWDEAIIAEKESENYDKIIALISNTLSPTDRMYKALQENNLEELNKAIQDGADPKKGNCPGEIPTLFIRSTKAIKPQGNQGKTYPIHTAAAWAGKKIMTKLLQNSPNSIEKKDMNGNTPLLIASLSHNLEATKTLIKMGANKDAKNNDGNNALEVAVLLPEIELIQIGKLKPQGDKVVAYLLKHGIPLKKWPKISLCDSDEIPLLIAAYGYFEKMLDEKDLESLKSMSNEKINSDTKEESIKKECIMAPKKLLFDGKTSLTNEEETRIKQWSDNKGLEFLYAFVGHGKPSEEEKTKLFKLLKESENTTLMKQWFNVLGNRKINSDKLIKKAPSKYLYSPKELYIKIANKRCFKKQPKTEDLSYFRENIEKAREATTLKNLPKNHITSLAGFGKNTITPDCKIIFQ